MRGANPTVQRLWCVTRTIGISFLGLILRLRPNGRFWRRRLCVWRCQHINKLRYEFELLRAETHKLLVDSHLGAHRGAVSCFVFHVASLLFCELH